MGNVETQVAANRDIEPQASATIDGEAVVLCPKTGLSLFDELHSGRRERDVTCMRSF